MLYIEETPDPLVTALSCMRLPRSRADIEATQPSIDVVVELLCDIRDLLGECAVRLSDLEARAADADR